jgi:hypothetical protein
MGDRAVAARLDAVVIVGAGVLADAITSLENYQFGMDGLTRSHARV